MRVPAAAALALALFAGAAGAQAAETRTYAVVLRDGRIEPARLEVPAGVKIKLTIRNEGPGPCEFENLDLRVEKVLAPGARSFVVIHPLRPGSYRFFDEFHPDTSEMLLIAR
jgi:hypothetical protein